MFIVLIVVVLGFSVIRSKYSYQEEDQRIEDSSLLPTVLQPYKDLIGLDLEHFRSSAIKRGVGMVRVIEEDGVSLPVTKDLRNDRLNIAVETRGDKKIVTRLSSFA